jgi:hypothetical protein
MMAILSVLVLAASAATPRASPAGRSTQGAQVTAFVRDGLAGRVVVLENGLAVANRHVLAYLAARESVVLLAGGLTQQALVLLGAGHDLAGVLPPSQLEGLPALQMARLVEDLALFAQQTAGLLQEAVAALTTPAPAQTVGEDAITRVLYLSRMRKTVDVLRRAAGWLDTIDRETGAHATLPGFGAGTSLDAQLTMLQ